MTYFDPTLRPVFDCRWAYNGEQTLIGLVLQIFDCYLTGCYIELHIDKTSIVSLVRHIFIEWHSIRWLLEREYNPISNTIKHCNY